METVRELALKTKEAAKQINDCSYELRHAALRRMAAAVRENAGFILEENEKDLALSKGRRTTDALYDRLRLTKARVFEIADAIDNVHDLPDCLGEVLSMKKRPNGMTVGVKRVSMGVVAMIYEARPNVTADAAALCVKTGNAVVLRGGKEAINSNKAIVSVLKEAVSSLLPTDVITLITDTERESALELMRLNGIIDVLIPRGGAGLIKSVVENASVPVIETGVGNCHIYVNESADFGMALNILVNAKTQRPGVCNAAESFLVDASIADEFMPLAYETLTQKNVKILGCERTRKLIDVEAASDEDYATEFLDLTITAKVVDGLDRAIEHIAQYSSGHSEAIITENYNSAQTFLDRVNSAAVYVNASTRFTDGGEFGFGAEIGISTQKLHVRGPMGIEALTTTKYIIYGSGQTR